MMIASRGMLRSTSAGLVASLSAQGSRRRRPCLQLPVYLFDSNGYKAGINRKEEESFQGTSGMLRKLTNSCVSEQLNHQ